jgi:hypothetical protein
MDTIIAAINSLPDAVRIASPFVRIISIVLHVFYGVTLWEDWSVSQ